MPPLPEAQRKLLERLATEPDDFVEIGDAREPAAICATFLASRGLVQLDSVTRMNAACLRAKITAKGRRHLEQTPPSP